MKIGQGKIGAPTAIKLPVMVTPDQEPLYASFDDRLTPLDGVPLHIGETVISPVFSVSNGDTRNAARVKSLRQDVEDLVEENEVLSFRVKLVLVLAFIGMALSAVLGAVLT